VEAISGAGGLQLVNTLDVEEYIRGMGEVLDGSWPTAALQAQAVAARTYAMDAMADGRSLCSSQQCQVYLGQTAEYGAMNRAVAATRGQVLMYRGSLAEAVYSANSGGVTATPEEGFGMTGVDYPYLISSPHRTNDPQTWEVRLPLESMSARLRYPGRSSGVIVSRTGPSGRALEITFSGEAGPYAVPGHRFMTELSLRSSLFTLRIEGGPQPPEPANGAVGAPPPGGVRARPVAFEAGGVGPRPLGRAHWAAVATLLLAGWSVAMHRHLPHDRSRTSDRSKTSDL
jgi:stage II sporulation protein D